MEITVDPAQLRRTPEETVLDPVFRFAYNNLPDRVQRGIEAGNPQAVKRLYAEYDRLRTGAPNRATRRAARGGSRKMGTH